MRYRVAGEQLRALRENQGLTLKDVENRSRQIAEARENVDYLFTAGRLSQVENSNSLPSLYKLASLSEIYQISYDELLRAYGIEPNRGSPNSAAAQESPHPEPDPDYVWQ